MLAKLLIRKHWSRWRDRKRISNDWEISDYSKGNRHSSCGSDCIRWGDRPCVGPTEVFPVSIRVNVERTWPENHWPEHPSTQLSNELFDHSDHQNIRLAGRWRSPPVRRWIGIGLFQWRSCKNPTSKVVIMALFEPPTIAFWIILHAQIKMKIILPESGMECCTGSVDESMTTPQWGVSRGIVLQSIKDLP